MLLQSPRAGTLAPVTTTADFPLVKPARAIQRLCTPEGDMAVACLNNRAACHVQLKSYLEVVGDASEVLVAQISMGPARQ